MGAFSVRSLLMIYSFFVTVALMIVIALCQHQPERRPEVHQGSNFMSVLAQKSTELQSARQGARFAQSSIIKASQKHNAKKDALLKELLQENQQNKEELRAVLSENAKLTIELKRARRDKGSTKKFPKTAKRKKRKKE